MRAQLPLTDFPFAVGLHCGWGRVDDWEDPGVLQQSSCQESFDTTTRAGEVPGRADRTAHLHDGGLFTQLCQAFDVKVVLARKNDEAVCFPPELIRAQRALHLYFLDLEGKE